MVIGTPPPQDLFSRVAPVMNYSNPFTGVQLELAIQGELKPSSLLLAYIQDPGNPSQYHRRDIFVDVSIQPNPEHMDYVFTVTARSLAAVGRPIVQSRLREAIDSNPCTAAHAIIRSTGERNPTIDELAREGAAAYAHLRVERGYVSSPLPLLQSLSRN